MRNPYLLLCTITFLYGSRALAQTSTNTASPEPSPAPTSAAIVRPSSGETITVGAPYTISWSPPPASSGPLAIELFGKVGALWRLGPNDTTCDGWLINTECDKFDVDIPAGSTSYVWNLSAPYENWQLLYDELPFTMGLYEDSLERGELPESDAEWYWSVEFMLAEGKSSTTTTRSTTTSSTTGTTATSTAEPDGTEAEDGSSTTDDSGDAVPTDGGCVLAPGSKVGVALVAAWALTYLA
ncbi:uncharacterized protein BDV14DRAFT_195876 [Aspergillus stella-maris]|uniref:uncharacterized protein n=1 Tax=Aspergillus stella-maris TaxID=1810926 RepID=UPI003CCD7839